MAGEQAAILWTDPPYGVSYASKNEFLNRVDKGNRLQRPIEGDHQTPEQMQELWRRRSRLVGLATEAGGVLLRVTGPQGGDLQLLLLMSLRESGFPLRHMFVWAKNNHVLGRCDYHYKHEPILYGWVEGAAPFYGKAGETSVWEIARPHRSDLHPTMKPVELVARAIRNSSRGGDIGGRPHSLGPVRPDRG